MAILFLAVVNVTLNMISLRPRYFRINDHQKDLLIFQMPLPKTPKALTYPLRRKRKYPLNAVNTPSIRCVIPYSEADQNGDTVDYWDSGQK
ncbi:hypothetical protein KCP71_04915 [Salmonella enterica subsp. enterica]|nr:hypothetical protein KCP71_04915 [Salmonella enterica subsp. enterica]